MFTVAERERIRGDLVARARADQRISGGAMTGSGSVDREDRWSDIDLAFGVREGIAIADVMRDFTSHMYEQHEAVHHFDVTRGSAIYRVFLLRSTLQVDLAFSPAPEFTAVAETFRLLFGTSCEGMVPLPQQTAEEFVGNAWLYALHARSSIARGKPWAAAYMIASVRDNVMALACLRFGLTTRQARGVDRLPADVTRPLEGSLLQDLSSAELLRALQVTMDSLVTEARHVDEALARRLEPTLRELQRSAS